MSDVYMRDRRAERVIPLVTELMKVLNDEPDEMVRIAAFKILSNHPLYTKEGQRYAAQLDRNKGRANGTL